LNYHISYYLRDKERRNFHEIKEWKGSICTPSEINQFGRQGKGPVVPGTGRGLKITPNFKHSLKITTTTDSLTGAEREINRRETFKITDVFCVSGF
jgi:hypothetical protein